MIFPTPIDFSLTPWFTELVETEILTKLAPVKYVVALLEAIITQRYLTTCSGGTKRIERYRWNLR